MGLSQPSEKTYWEEKTITERVSQKNGCLTSVEGAGSLGKKRKRRTGFLKGHAAVLRTGVNPYEYELNYIHGKADLAAADCSSLTALHSSD